ncbi:hypothetical protein SDC9_165511 [bioreactor metagenome]|uniref:Uncharacterized protein n=1 Tax=bioreactor metagenome TaxID=1076179 RepID=A0A645G1S7_9ZZZZ
MLFRFINPLSKTSKFNYYCSIYKINNGDTSLVKSAEDNEIKEYENYIDWTPDFVIENSNSDNSNYFVTVHQKDMNTNLISGKLIVPFNVYHLLKDEEAVWSVRSKDEMNVFKLQNMNVTESKNNLYKVSLSQDSLDGKAVSALIGPSTKWNKINIGGNFEAPNATSRIIISGYKNSTGTAEKLIDIEPNSEINISSINANEYPFITVTFASMRTDETSEHYLSDLSVVFTPSAEIAVKSQTDFANKNSVLRGDTVKLNLFAENI